VLVATGGWIGVRPLARCAGRALCEEVGDAPELLTMLTAWRSSPSSRGGSGARPATSLARRKVGDEGLVMEARRLLGSIRLARRAAMGETASDDVLRV
jgi:hypothetical protein